MNLQLGPPPNALIKPKTLIWIALALVVLWIAKDYVLWKSDFRAWADQRADWHQRCDQYVGRIHRQSGR